MKNVIKGLSESKRAEIMNIFGGAVQEVYVAGFEEGYAIGQAASSTVGDNPEFRTEKRHAKVGERVLITNAFPTHDYKNGEVLTVGDCHSDGAVYAIGRECSIEHDEYEVIIEEDETFEHEGKLLRKVNREALEGDYARFSKVQARRTTSVTPGRFYEVESDKGRLVFKCDGVTGTPYMLYGNFGRTTDNVEVFEVVGNVGYIHHVSNDKPAPLTANQQRAEVNQRAREFVEDWTLKNRNGDEFKNREFPSGLWFVDAKGNSPTINIEFHVNAKKRTVIVLIKDLRGNKLRAKGIAKCMPGRVFNADIGKAIALARALEIDIPQEFIDAIQPDVVVVGMVVRKHSNANAGLNQTVNKIDGTCHFSGFEEIEFWTKEFVGSLVPSQINIIDDTNAVYDSVGA